MFGFDVRVETADVDETIPPRESADDAVQRLALCKAEAVGHNHPASLVLGADTVVVLDGTILGKPVDANDAHRMLSSLSGRQHRVHTGIALVHAASGRSVTAVETALVTVDTLSSAEIDAYIATGSPMDKAGAYGIQDDTGALLIRGIEGDFYTVMGLPLNRLYRLIPASFPDLILP